MSPLSSASLIMLRPILQRQRERDNSQIKQSMNQMIWKMEYFCWPVFDASTRLHWFELCSNVSNTPVSDSVEIHHWCASNQLSSKSTQFQKPITKGQIFDCIKLSPLKTHLSDVFCNVDRFWFLCSHFVSNSSNWSRRRRRRFGFGFRFWFCSGGGFWRDGGYDEGGWWRFMVKG